MAENWKHLYEQMKKMVAMYQDEIVPGLRKQVEELESGSKWIPVTERLPEQYRSVIVWTSERELGEAQFDGKHFEWCADEAFADVTHWMPLPEPPKGE